MTDERRHFEQADDLVPGRTILRVIAGTLVIGIILSCIAYAFLLYRTGRLRPSRAFPERLLPGPHLQGGLQSDLFEAAEPRLSLPAQQRESLTRYRWVDKRRGIIQVPIDEAMKLYLRSRR